MPREGSACHAAFPGYFTYVFIRKTIQTENVLIRLRLSIYLSEKFCSSIHPRAVKDSINDYIYIDIKIRQRNA